jgi:hypothetical protein
VAAGSITTLGSRKLLIITVIRIDDLRQTAGDIQIYKNIEEIQGKLPVMARNIASTAGRPASPALEKLAVPPIETSGNIDSSVADVLAQILSVYLTKSDRYLVYPRTATLEKIQEEYKNQSDGRTADDQRMGIGRGDNPDLVLAVVARRLGNRTMFNAAIINLESGQQLIGRSENYDSLNDGVDAMANPSRELTDVAVDSRTAGKNLGAAGYGALNLALGPGSFLQRDIAGGIVCVTGYGAAAGLIIWEMSLAYGERLAGVPGTIGLGTLGATVLWGFIRPALYQKRRKPAGSAEGAIISVIPGNKGGGAVTLSYTWQF